MTALVLGVRLQRSEVNAPIIGLHIHKDRCGSSQ